MSQDTLKDEIDLRITIGRHTIYHRRKPNPTILVYFISGNPGLIQYYRDFLTYLYDADELNTEISRFRIYGHSLGGFGVAKTTHNKEKQPPYMLREQIDNVQRDLYHLCDSWLKDDPAEAAHTGEIQVILVGHSVGAYILLELLAEQQRYQKSKGSTGNDEKYNYRVIGGIGLFPTIVHLARSPRGRKVAAFANFPGLSIMLHLLVRVLMFLMPNFLLMRVLASLMPHASSAAKETTAAFLRSRDGVRQALYMGQHELLEMTHDKWDDDLWGSTPSLDGEEKNGKVSCDRPPLYFYFGENDYWIDNKIRDDLIACRARTEGSPGSDGKPHMEIDAEGVPHDFCINQRYSRLIAEKVAKFIEEILDKQG